jgi:hypothetical protein
MSGDRLSGMYKGFGVEGSQQFAVSGSGTDQMAIDLEIDAGDGSTRLMTTFLYFSPKAIQYALERLRALGWDGRGSPLDATGISRNAVNVSVTYETYDGKERMRVEIVTGGGRVELQPMDPAAKRAMAARVAALMGGAGAGVGASAPMPQMPQMPASARNDAHRADTAFPFGANAPSGKAGF